MTSCAHLYTCPFWISVGLYLRGRSTSIKQSGVFPRENETKINYDKWDYLNNLEDSRVADSQVTKPCASWCHHHNRILLQTSFGHISTNSLMILMVSTATESP